MPTVVTQNAANPWNKSSDREKEILNRVGSDVESFERGIGRDFHDNCVKWYRQYRGFRKFEDAWVSAGPPDRDALVYDAKRSWGSHLHIPLTYRTIEDGVPKAIAQRPKMLYLPRHERWVDNVQPLQMLMDSQQEQVDVELTFQDQMRAGYIYGIGFGKSFWRKEYALKRQVRRRMFRPNEFAPGKLLETCTFDDPDYEDLDVFDVMWDPFGSDVKSCGWMLHRSWLGLRDVMERLQSGVWNTASAKQLTEDDVRAKGESGKYDDVWSERMEASGFSSFHTSVRGEQIHEVWEWHDGNRVYSVLDREVLVQDAENPCVGTMPFTAYRPTRVPKQMVGIGEPEALEHLQRELDTLRSQRRDAATLALAAGYAYDQNAVDEEDLVFGPAAAIPVRNASPRDALMPLQIKEPPGTSYQEETVIRGDMAAISGENDQMMQPTVASTATEAQLVQAAVSMRIGMKSRRFEVEVVRQSARAWLALNQRMILSDKTPIRQPGEGLTLEQAAEEGRWRWFPIGPGELQGEFEVIPEGGSMAAPNIQQNIQIAQMMLGQIGQSPYIDPAKPLLRALSLLGEKDPESWLKKGEEPVPPRALQLIEEMGFDPRLIQHAVAQAQQEDPQLQGPTADDLPALGMAA
jgi:hypothetical protein